MSASGQKRTRLLRFGMSALPSKADIERRPLRVRYGQERTLCSGSLRHPSTCQWMLTVLLEHPPVPRCVGRPKTWTWTKSMASKKKVAAKPQVWNKDLEVGRRDGFTPAQVKRICRLLADRGVPGLRDLALFSTAVDTMLHGQDLLPLVVGEVQRRNGSIRPVIEVARARGKPPVRCALSKVSAKTLAKWIASSGKKRTDYLFPGDALGSRPMSGRQLNRLLKLWVAEATRSHGLWRRIFTSDEGSPHLERHWRFTDGSSALGQCDNREHSEVSRSHNKGRPDHGLSSLRYLTVSVCCVAANVGRGLQEIFECEACSQCDQIVMSALPPKADIRPRDQNVCFGQKRNSCSAAIQTVTRSPRRRGRAARAGW